MHRSTKTIAQLSTALVSLVIVTGSAHAGAFALREQSAYYQGMSFAGNAAGGPSISSMFWNPASITGAADGFTFEAHNSFIIPESSMDGTFTPSGLVAGLGQPASSAPSGDLASDAWIPATYTTYRLNDDIVLGLGVNAPFGLSTKPETNWAAQYYSRSSEVFTISVNPTVAYQVNDMLSVGAGVQVQYIQVRLKSAYAFAASPAGSPASTQVKGSDVGFGVTAGLTFKPLDGTVFGLGYRSTVSHTLDGNFSNPAGVAVVPGVGAIPFAGSRTGIEANVMMPDMVTLSATQDITDRIRVAGTVEWTNWSRVGTIHLTSTGGTTTNPTGLPDLEFNYEDGWFFSVGGEYDWNEDLTLRAGIAYELSPIDQNIRSTRLPDNDRLWLSAGLSWEPMDHVALDLGYTHIIPDDTRVSITPGHQDYNANIGTYTSDVDSHVNILTAALRVKF
ncbi:MAG: transporter [Roseibium sp.]|nr:transporter [Roseibium sp.]